MCNEEVDTSTVNKVVVVCCALCNSCESSVVSFNKINACYQTTVILKIIIIIKTTS